jgi:RNA polymerase sigma-70 factor (ECF subfamily)
MANPPAELSDSELAARYEAGDQEALASLCRRHYAPVFQFAYRLTQTVPEAEDCTQEAFVRFLRSWARWQARERGAAPWLFTIVRHVVIDRWQAAARLPLPATDAWLGVAAPDGDAPDHAALDREVRAAAAQALARVEAPCRELFGFLFQDRLTQREAAAKLGLTHEAVKKRYQRCLQRVQRDLAARGMT